MTGSIRESGDSDREVTTRGPEIHALLRRNSQQSMTYCRYGLMDFRPFLSCDQDIIVSIAHYRIFARIGILFFTPRIVGISFTALAQVKMFVRTL